MLTLIGIIGKLFKTRKGVNYLQVALPSDNSGSGEGHGEATDEEDMTEGEKNPSEYMVDYSRDEAFSKYANELEQFHPFQYHTKLTEMNARISYAAIEYSKKLRDHMDGSEDRLRRKIEKEMYEEESERQQLVESTNQGTSKTCVIQ
eukprot:TRINITY_DN19735_c0_g1_i1.p1 TRINITY_DN19735_c0_g1~~TRINITY_DN19735_c0_g1_i1.p1  ORF type:complete len:147 (-),score=33.73 TRINITY_DN19735_c0_g1_i1:32-472(-)